MPKRRKTFIQRNALKWSAFFVAGILIIVAIYFAYRVFGPNTMPFSDHKYFYVRTGARYADVVKALEQQGIVKNIASFEWIAKKANYPAHVHAGRFEIGAGMSNLEIVRLLRSGKQAPLQLVINKLRTPEDLARLVGQQMEPDSTAMMAVLTDPVYLRQFGLDTATALCAVIPNTYEFFWNTPAEAVFERLEKEKRVFWTPERQAAARALDLTTTQAYILASIVEEETTRNSEKPTIASVYLNRLRTGMRLGADPTVKYAVGDFSLRRITSRETASLSPYNTYRYAGLPPGPICTPSIKTIDAILKAPATNYYYFCARADFSGYHVFADSYAEHMKNARAYQLALNQRNIH